MNQNENTQQIAETVSKARETIDDISWSAFLIVVHAMADGLSTEESYNAGNAYLIAHGRKPVPLP